MLKKPLGQRLIVRPTSSLYWMIIRQRVSEKTARSRANWTELFRMAVKLWRVSDLHPFQINKNWVSTSDW
jgi:hypothetical protein